MLNMIQRKMKPFHQSVIFSNDTVSDGSVTVHLNVFQTIKKEAQIMHGGTQRNSLLSNA